MDRSLASQGRLAVVVAVYVGSVVVRHCCSLHMRLVGIVAIRCEAALGLVNCYSLSPKRTCCMFLSPSPSETVAAFECSRLCPLSTGASAHSPPHHFVSQLQLRTRRGRKASAHSFAPRQSRTCSA